MHFLCFMSLHLSYYFVLGTESETITEPGSCSRRCQALVQPDNTTTEALPKFPCSCSPSCSLYEDCCYDAPTRSSGSIIKKSPTVCLPVTDSGEYRAVAKCPKDWKHPSSFCTDTIGIFPPVTSKASGTTYANTFCAICHGDGEDLETWPVELRCCAEHNGIVFFDEMGYLRSRTSIQGKCFCRYHVHNNDTSFLNKLELRTCHQTEMISGCSSSWPISEDEEICKAFLDPVYSEDEIYRNQYCARCNSKALQQVKCLPSVLALAQGAGNADIVEYCQKHNLSICDRYLMSEGQRGRLYSFSSLLNVRKKPCVPEPRNKKCCPGQRYDAKTIRCRKLVS